MHTCSTHSSTCELHRSHLFAQLLLAAVPPLPLPPLLARTPLLLLGTAGLVLDVWGVPDVSPPHTHASTPTHSHPHLCRYNLLLEMK